FADARGVSDAKFYVNDNNQKAVLSDPLIMPGADGALAPLFGVNADNFAYVANDQDYQVLNATITAWFNPVDLGGKQTIFAKDERNADGGGHFHVRVDDDGKLFIRVAEGEGKNDGGYNHEWKSKKSIVQEGNWQHIALTIGAEGVVVYLNGAAQADSQFDTLGGDPKVPMSEFVGGYLIGNDKPLVIGANTRVSEYTDTAEALGVDEDLGQFFEGGISDIGIWGGDTPDDALNAEQVAELYANGPGDLSSAPPAAAPAVLVSDDEINGNGGDDEIDGGAGNDDLDGGAGNDLVYGGYGDDLVDGGAGDDTLMGGHGRDYLRGGDGDDLIKSLADDREPEIAQEFDRSDDPDYELDFASRMLYPSQANMPSNDVLEGGDGADEFFFQTLINGKLDIINRHVNDDRTINWHGVAGENNNVHDHWVDGVGDDLIKDFDRTEGDKITIDGHTTEVSEIRMVDADGDGDVDDSVMQLRSNQGNGGGAHNLDLLGTITVLNTEITEADYTTNAGSHAGIVRTIDEYKEAITPLVNEASGDPWWQSLADAPPASDDTPADDEPPASEDDGTPEENDDNGELPPPTTGLFDPFADQVSAEAGTSGNDLFEGADASDRFNGRNGDDLALGDDGADLLRGNRGNDRLAGEDGNDRVNGGFGNDIVSGGDDDDRVNGGRGIDIVMGDDGNDRANGGQGNDVVLGGEGDDRVNGGDGDDILIGGDGANIYNGGRGTDTAVLSGDIDDYDVNLRANRMAFEDSEGERSVLRNVEQVYFSGSGESYTFADGELTEVASLASFESLLAEAFVSDTLSKLVDTDDDVMALSAMGLLGDTAPPAATASIASDSVDVAALTIADDEDLRIL
ncbi:MAG: LamG-like jellyroll fold domain-containing protein, partial [Pseudomonadota bacterium]